MIPEWLGIEDAVAAASGLAKLVRDEYPAAMSLAHIARTYQPFVERVTEPEAAAIDAMEQAGLLGEVGR